MPAFILPSRSRLLLVLFLIPLGVGCHQLPLWSPAADQPDFDAIRNQRPEWITQIPSGHFVGVAARVEDIQKGREEAVNEVRRQIVSAIGTEVSLSYRAETHFDDPEKSLRISDIVENQASGYLEDVETNIIAYYEETVEREGAVNIWVLISYPDGKIETARRKLQADNRMVKAHIEGILARASRFAKEGRVYQALEQFETAIVATGNLLLSRRSSRDRAIGEIEQLLRSTSLYVHGVYPARSSSHTHSLYLTAAFRGLDGSEYSGEVPLVNFPLLVNYPMNGERQIQMLITDEKGIAIFPFSVPVVEGDDRLVISVPQPILREYTQTEDPFLREAVDAVETLYRKRERIVTLSKLFQRDPPLLFPRKPGNTLSN